MREKTAKQILDSLPESSRRVCPMIRKMIKCDCTGCATSKGISKEMIEKYLKDGLK